MHTNRLNPSFRRSAPGLALLVTVLAAGSAFPQTAGTADTNQIHTYTVNKPVAEFPAGRDLSTPEAACAAWQRASARKDVQAISQLSWVTIDPKKKEQSYRLQEQKDPKGLALFQKSLEDSKILVVQVWRGELASVVTYLPFPPGKGRDPYSARTFGRINGEWKNLGEDRLPSLEAAQANFEKKREVLWSNFESLRRERDDARRN